MLDSLYKASAKKVAILDVPPMNFLMMDGQGDPNSSVFEEAMQAMYAVAYTLKFAIKKQLGVEFKVMPLEGLWWTEDMNDFRMDDKSNWQWTVMIMQPEVVTAEWVARACEEVRHKKNMTTLPRFESYHEGQAAQTLHIGPYEAEAPTIAALHEFIHQNGYALTGKHHEIYLGDPRRAAPEKLKTIIRQPIVQAG